MKVLLLAPVFAMVAIDLVSGIPRVCRTAKAVMKVINDANCDFPSGSGDDSVRN